MLELIRTEEPPEKSNTAESMEWVKLVAKGATDRAAAAAVMLPDTGYVSAVQKAEMAIKWARLAADAQRR
jgi:hypothetical protein